MTTYTFSVVATNSIGSGEAGIVMITTPGEFIHSFCMGIVLLVILTEKTLANQLQQATVAKYAKR